VKVKTIMKVDHKYANNFIKIPNGIITDVVKANEYVSMLYAYFGFNKNIMGQVVTNIDTIKDYFFKTGSKDYHYQRDRDIIEGMIMLHNGVVDGEGYNLSSNVVEVRLEKEYRGEISFENDEGEIKVGDKSEDGDIQNDYCQSLKYVANKIYSSPKFESFNNFSKIMMTVSVNNDDVSDNFTKLYVYEYCRLYEVYKVYSGKGEKIKFNELLNMYLYIKCIVDRHMALNKMYPNGWKNKEYIEEEKLIERYKGYRAFVVKYLDWLEKGGMICRSKIKSKDKNGNEKGKGKGIVELMVEKNKKSEKNDKKKNENKKNEKEKD